MDALLHGAQYRKDHELCGGIRGVASGLTGSEVKNNICRWKYRYRVPKNITLRKIEVWHNRWIFKNEFFNNFPTYRRFWTSGKLAIFNLYHNSEGWIQTYEFTLFVVAKPQFSSLQFDSGFKNAIRFRYPYYTWKIVIFVFLSIYQHLAESLILIEKAHRFGYKCT